MERDELKEAILRDLNAEEYPFIIEVKGNTIIGRWKTQEILEGANPKRYRPFSVEYKLRADGTFYGGEMTVHCDEYKPPMSAESRGVYSVTANENLKWRKKVDVKDWSTIDHDEQKLFSIIEHYLIDKGFSYRPGVWKHAYIGWRQGHYLRLVGALLLFVGTFIFIGSLGTGNLFLNLFPWIHILVGAWVLLIGIGKIPFYHLRNDILIKVIIGTIAIGWLLVFACMFFDIDPLGFLFR